MNILRRTSFNFIFAIILALSSLANHPSLASAKNKQNPLPEAPETGTPATENSSPGGTRTESPQKKICTKKKKPLTSLLATNNIDFTLSQYPTFWFYVPFAPEKIGYMEFTLYDSEDQLIHQTVIKPEGSGIVKISLPKKPKSSLKPETDYSWTLILQCSENRTNEPDLAIKGWIRRVSAPQIEERLKRVKNKKYTVYIDSDLLYDAVTNLAALRQANPQNSELNADWVKLLDLLGWKELAEEPFVNSVILSAKQFTTTNFPRE